MIFGRELNINYECLKNKKIIGSIQRYIGWKTRYTKVAEES